MILSKGQKKILTIISEVPLLKDNFFLTGGTALSEFYLQHRYSEDIDFFTEKVPDITPLINIFQKKLKEKKLSFEIKRALNTFSDMIIKFKDETLKIDFAIDSPYRLKKILFSKEYNIFYDNKIDISCNKLSALFDRGDPKDFVDIYFIHKEIISLEELIPLTKKKHIGLDEYWLSRAFFRAKEISFLPKMIKQIDIKKLKNFFLGKSLDLMK